ncbi:cyclophilin-like domain-containing protein [Chytridium lagenaria]|nr:cyclophilin-like domain-containing protein [Chytridium lagenaria]
MMGEEAFLREISQIAHKFVYFDVQIDKVPIGRIIAEIYTDIVPETAAKFMSFVEGTAKHPYNHGELLKYSGTKVTRCIKEGWIQAGEFQTSNDDGPLVGETFGDENFIIHHTHRGQLSMVNYGAHSNYSQFMIVLKEMPYFNHKFVSIGRCIDGHHVLDIIEHHHTMTTTTLSTITPTTTAAAAADLATHTNGERPTKDIEFVNVGELII